MTAAIRGGLDVQTKIETEQTHYLLKLNHTSKGITLTYWTLTLRGSGLSPQSPGAALPSEMRASTSCPAAWVE